MAMNVQFLQGTQKKYDDLAKAGQIVETTFYYITDSTAPKLYLGSMELTGGSGSTSGGVSEETFKELKDLVGVLPAGITSTNVVDYIIETIGSLEIRKNVENPMNTEENLTNLIYTSVTDCIQDLTIFDTAKASKAVGGINIGDKLTGKSVYEVLMDMLCPYVAPSFDVSHDVSTTLEKGDNSKVIKQGKVRITDSGSNAVTKFEIYNGSTLLGSQNGPFALNTWYSISNLNISVPTSGIQLTAKVYDDSEREPQTKKTASFSFVYPYYWGVCDNGAVVSEKLVEDCDKQIADKGNKNNITFNCTNQHMIFAYPKAHGLLKKIANSNPQDITSSFSHVEQDIVGLDGTTQTYYVYKSNDASTGTYIVSFTY